MDFGLGFWHNIYPLLIEKIYTFPAASPGTVNLKSQI
ncbi:hypothetical protein B6N60_02725 [Richelia sinica FACHB-800]|uniref:Uncharacterized protein n=1 Tax=Richelia sinica FACHB-800 TaxID=1357546 RepID=A0A975T8C3_9NOST|nr:hypothetical protein B6N60_02725 [Richelia sinica FACHB-800]